MKNWTWMIPLATVLLLAGCGGGGGNDGESGNDSGNGNNNGGSGGGDSQPVTMVTDKQYQVNQGDTIKSSGGVATLKLSIPHDTRNSTITLVNGSATIE